MVDDNAPENVCREAVITMDDVVAGINDFAGIRDLDIGHELEDTVHGLTHDLYVNVSSV